MVLIWGGATITLQSKNINKKRIPAFDKMPDIYHKAVSEQMNYSEQKRAPLTINDLKILPLSRCLIISRREINGLPMIKKRS